MTSIPLPDTAVLGSGVTAGVYYYRNGLARIVFPGEKLCPACTGGLGPDPDVLDWQHCRTCAGRGVVPDTVLDLQCAIGRGCNTPGREAQHLLTRWPPVDDEGNLSVQALCQLHLNFTLDVLDPDQPYIAEPLAPGDPVRVGYAIRRSDGPPIRVSVQDYRLGGRPLIIEGRSDQEFDRRLLTWWIERRYPLAQAPGEQSVTGLVAVEDAPAWRLDYARQRGILERYHRATNVSALAAFAERLAVLNLPAPGAVRLYTLLQEAGLEAAALWHDATAFPGAGARALAACAQADRAEDPDVLSPLVQIAAWYLATMAAEVV